MTSLAAPAATVTYLTSVTGGDRLLGPGSIRTLENRLPPARGLALALAAPRRVQAGHLLLLLSLLTPIWPAGFRHRLGSAYLRPALCDVADVPNTLKPKGRELLHERYDEVLRRRLTLVAYHGCQALA
jgi:hypothetical protein